MILPAVSILAALLAGEPAALAAGARDSGASPSGQSAPSAKLAGYYQLTPHAILRIWREGGRWYAATRQSAPIEITPKGDGVFAIADDAAEITFQTDARSNVTGLILRQDGRDLRAAKVVQSVAVSVDPSLGDSSIPQTWKKQLVGPPRVISAGDRGADYWPCFSSDSGSVLFAHTLDGQSWTLMRAPAAGGAAEPVGAAPLSVSATRPSWSASANLIAFTGTTGEHNHVWVMRPDGKDARAVTASGLSGQAFYPSWYPDGRHLVAVDARDNVIRRFDVGGGPAVAIIDHAKVLAGMPSVSPDGRWIAFAGQKNLGQAYDETRNVIWLAGDDGSLRPLEAEPQQGRAPVWSPDGSHLAFESDRGSPHGRYAVFIVAKDGTGLTQITPYELNATHPVWSPNGKRMALAIQAGDVTRIGIVDLPPLP